MPLWSSISCSTEPDSSYRFVLARPSVTEPPGLWPAAGPDAKLSGGVGPEGEACSDMRVLIRNLRQSRCRHRTTVAIQTLGFERRVCESCGHVDVRVPDDGESAEVEIERAVFARPSDIEPGTASHRHQAGE